MIWLFHIGWFLFGAVIGFLIVKLIVWAYIK